MRNIPLRKAVFLSQQVSQGGLQGQIGGHEGLPLGRITFQVANRGTYSQFATLGERLEEGQILLLGDLFRK